MATETDTTIPVDRETHGKILKLRDAKEKKEKRPVYIKEIVRDVIDLFIESQQVITIWLPNIIKKDWDLHYLGKPMETFKNVAELNAALYDFSFGPDFIETEEKNLVSNKDVKQLIKDIKDLKKDFQELNRMFKVILGSYTGDPRRRKNAKPN